ncbi:MATE family efflux transporter [Entomospira culicis]|uniref:Multidrug-efflux transporter n=1 Tax=Entomospira culicis TaxID=2719989 RepID=A0A968KV31_9SPIO|nr:MATE family efflux transporter [Entomospira culicis]NIZ18462.1 MATE family efflux transporter [Entomospira culicis]NIZ68678.1 MATE family efflux transporter [Entomospira culicis]WDI37277.1 MATE family efflux transporter [Entomospira culicis]WDI38906.1 MATE family efflux transporter [Entomospira culicis]
MDAIVDKYHTDQERTSYSRLLKVAIPMVIQGLMFSVMLLVDRIFVGNYDVMYLAAASTAGGLATAFGFFTGETVGFANNIVAQYYGAKRKNMLAAPVWAGLFLASIFAVLLVITLPLTQKIFEFSFFGHEEALIKAEQVYFRYIILMYAVMLFQRALLSYFIGIGQTYKMMIVMVAGNLSNILFDWLLIFGVGPFPEMGIAGAGLASLISAVVSLLIAIWFFVDAKRVQEDMLRPRFQPEIIKRLFLLGLPAGLQVGLEMLGFTVMQMFLGKISTAALAASAVSFGLQNIVYSPTTSVANAGAILIGQERGALRMHNFRLILRKVMIIGSVYSLLMLFIMWRFPEQLITIFDSGDSADPELLAETKHIARYFLLITGLWLVPDVFFNTYMQTLKALGDSRFISITMIIMVFALITLPAVFLSGIDAAWPKYVIYGMTIIYVIILWIIFGLRYRSGKWKDNHVID